MPNELVRAVKQRLEVILRAGSVVPLLEPVDIGAGIVATCVLCTADESCYKLDQRVGVVVPR